MVMLDTVHRVGHSSCTHISRVGSIHILKRMVVIISLFSTLVIMVGINSNWWHSSLHASLVCKQKVPRSISITDTNN